VDEELLQHVIHSFLYYDFLNNWEHWNIGGKIDKPEYHIVCMEATQNRVKNSFGVF
jgi:hypothetical protein